MNNDILIELKKQRKYVLNIVKSKKYKRLTKLKYYFKSNFDIPISIIITSIISTSILSITPHSIFKQNKMENQYIEELYKGNDLISKHMLLEKSNFQILTNYTYKDGMYEQIIYTFDVLNVELDKIQEMSIDDIINNYILINKEVIRKKILDEKDYKMLDDGLYYRNILISREVVNKNNLDIAIDYGILNTLFFILEFLYVMGIRKKILRNYLIEIKNKYNIILNSDIQYYKDTLKLLEDNISLLEGDKEYKKRV